MNETMQTSTIEIQLTKNDVLDFNFSFWRKNGSIWIMLLIGLCFLSTIIVYIVQGSPFRDYAFYLFFLLFIVLMPILTYRGAKRSFDNKFLQEKKTYVFTPEGFNMVSASASVNTLWADIKKVAITKNAVCLFVASNAAHIIPRRYLTGHEGIYAMIEQYTPKESRKAGKSRWLRNIAIYVLIFLVTVGIVQFILSRQ